MSEDMEKYLVNQDKLDKQYDILLANKNLSDRQRAMGLARFAEANIYGPITREMEKMEKQNTVIKEMLLASRSDP